ncbi:MAG: putative oxidoreductase YqjQ [Candidatus Nitrosocaldaceae archaeon]|nr:MAG: putative oxidoreductase YqjQ [Candidatus Nitrosocaldaceae archaeon]GIU72908.1 MAG: putative oxidoreductase YqjQ [Candidatus Nitrosocaldaceae archaeon]
MRFKDKNVLITGASSGIGREVAYLFAKEGANLALVARRLDKLEAIKNDLEDRYKQEFICIKCDVSNKDQVFDMSKQVLDRFKHIDVLVNNAGFAIFDKVIDTSIKDIEAQIQTNLLGAIYCIKAFLPIMLERNEGHIVNVASLAASVAVPNLASYCASKFGLLGFSQALYHELHNTNVGVTVVSPITVRTDFFSNDSFKDAKINLRFALDTKTVAKAILRAVNSKRLEITVPFYARGAVWLVQTFPYLLNPIIREMFMNMKR